MTPQTFIFTGRSGCGKGTQLALLKQKMMQYDPEASIYNFSTGDGFRSFFERDGHTVDLAKEVTHKGQLQPLFLTIYLWANAMINNMHPDSHMFIDGYPRRLLEAEVLHGALAFYKRSKPIVLNIVVSKEESKKRMLLRARADDTPDSIEERLLFYETDIVPTIDWYRINNAYTVIDIPGERPIEEIHADIIHRLGFA